MSKIMVLENNFYWEDLKRNIYYLDILEKESKKEENSSYFVLDCGNNHFQFFIYIIDLETLEICLISVLKYYTQSSYDNHFLKF